MDLTFNRTLAGRALPPGSQVISAVNEGEEYQLTDLDPALVSRFNVYQFAPTVEDWLVWANAKGIDDRVIAFIQGNSEYLDGDPKHEGAGASFGADLVRTPDRRAWQRVSESLANVTDFSPLHLKFLAGMIGINGAILFAKSLQNSKLISADDILLRFAKTKSRLMKLQTHEFAGLNERLVLRIQKGGFTAAAKKKVLKNFHAYIELLLMNEQSEACAHLASMLERPRYEAASQFLLADSDILNQMVGFIQAIAID